MTKIVTHNSHFHTDDLFGVATLLIHDPTAIVVRTRDEEIISTADYVVDVGGIYDEKNNRFDHHQTQGAGIRPNGIPYASFGLVWKKYGVEICTSQEAADLIEEKLVAGIDAIDNGVQIFRPLFGEIREYTFSDYLDSFMDEKKTIEEFDVVFNYVLPIVKSLLINEIKIAQSKIAEWEEVKKIYDNSENKKIIILNKPLSWKKILIPTEALYVISERPDGKWQARAVPRELNSFDLKKPFPIFWSGKREEELAKITGVPDSFFCHRDRFLAIANTKEGATKLAQEALNE